MNWFGDGFRKIHILYVSPHWAARRAEAFDARTWIETFSAAGVETVELYCKDHHGICYYNSAIGRPYPRDVLGELVEQTRSAGIKLMAYFSVGYDAYAFGINQDWLTMSAEGKPFQYGPFLHGCLNTPYREYALGQIEEIVRQYPVDGLWLDIVSFLYKTPEHGARHLLAPCYCIHCRRKYRERFGHPPPLAPSLEEAKQAYRWQVEGVRSFLDEAYRIARSYRSDQVITYNGAGGPADPIDSADLTSIEAHAPDYSRQSFIARWSRSRGRPFEVLTPGGLPGARGGWDSWDQKPASVMAIEVGVVLAQGGSQVIGVTPYPDGSIDPAQLEELGKVFRRVESLEDRVRGATSVAQIAICLGTKPLDAPHLWSKAVASAQSWHAALLAGHFLYDVVPSVAAALRYPAVVVPDSIPLSADDARLLSDYVARGGRLLVTGRTGLLDEHGLLRQRSALDELLGVRFRAMSEHTFAYLHLADPALRRDIPDLPILAKGQPIEVERAGAETLAELRLPETAMSDATTILWGFPPPLPEGALPGVTARREGDGLAMYVALPLETRGFESLWSRQLAVSLAEHLIGGRWLATDAPSGVEVVLNRLGEKLILHLIDHRAGDPEYGLGGGEPTRNGLEVAVDARALPFARAAVVPTGEEVAVERSDGWARLRLPSFDVHLVVELAP